MRKTALVLFAAVVSCASAAFAANGPSTTIFISGDANFSTALTAAMVKKHVPADVVTDANHAEYTLQAAAVDSKDESGAGKVARCLFLDCVGMNGYSEVSVKLIRNKDQAIVWAYQVRKSNSGPLGVQSLSEAIAKHLKNDYLDKHKEI